MRTFKILFTLILIAVIGVNTGFASNNDKTEIRKVKSFNAIKVSTGIDLYITMGETEEVKVIANNDIIDKLITEVKDGMLRIYMKDNNWFNQWGNKSRKVYVSIKELIAITASSGSDVYSENTLKGEKLRVKASSGSDIKIDIYYKNFLLDVSSGSDAKISGKVKTFEVEASSGSDIKAQNLQSKICKAQASSGADITLKVSDELYAKASSGGDIHYYGDPAISDINESSGGDVRQK